MEYDADEHRVYCNVYTIAWVTRRSKQVLSEKIKERCRDIITEACRERNWKLKELDISSNHVILKIRTFPSNSAEEIVKYLKNCTAHYIRREFPEVLKIPSLWTGNYISSTKDIDKEVLETFLDAQKGI